jgi:hypothetical protein
MRARSETLVFAAISYALIAALGLLYVHFRVGVRVLWPFGLVTPQPLPVADYSVVSAILVVVAPPCICLIYARRSDRPRHR